MVCEYKVNGSMITKVFKTFNKSLLTTLFFFLFSISNILFEDKVNVSLITNYVKNCNVMSFNNTVNGF